MMGPLNPPRSRLCMTMEPTLRGRLDAPMTATDAGRKRESKLMMLIVCQSRRRHVLHEAGDDGRSCRVPMPGSKSISILSERMGKEVRTNGGSVEDVKMEINVGSRMRDHGGDNRAARGPRAFQKI